MYGTKKMRNAILGGLLSMSIMVGSSVMTAAAPLTIAEQGVFSAGGITVTSPGTFESKNQWEGTGAGQTAHVDHASVLYQLPVETKGLPMVFLHGYGQSRTGWMSTPDGREGWAGFFLRQGHGVFLLDAPHRGEAGATSVPGVISDKTLDQRWYTQFRIGRWEQGKPVFNQGSKFPQDERSVDQFFRQMTPDTGMKSDMGADFNKELVAKALAASVDEVYTRTGKKSIVFCHSQGGRATWPATKYTKNIAAIVAIEPGGAPEPGSEDYLAVAEQHIPVVFYFGDYIDNGDTVIQATAAWQKLRGSCYAFRDAYQAAGGQVEVIDLPKVGIYGNDHFIFEDKNSDTVAMHVEDWLQKHGVI